MLMLIQANHYIMSRYKNLNFGNWWQSNAKSLETNILLSSSRTSLKYKNCLKAKVLVLKSPSHNNI